MQLPRQRSGDRDRQQNQREGAHQSRPECDTRSQASFSRLERTFAVWLVAGGALALIAALTLGGHGMSAYWSELRGLLPPRADALTLKGAVGATGVVALVIRILIVGMVLATASRLRASRALAVPVGIVGSLLVSSYVHNSDLCLLAVAAWMAWEQTAAISWRWVGSSPARSSYSLDTAQA